MSIHSFTSLLLGLSLLIANTVNAGPPPKRELINEPEKIGGIVLYGHSLYGSLRGLDKDYDLPITSRGWGGARAIDLLNAFDERVLPLQPKLIFMNIGANELVRGSAGRFERDFKKLIKHITTTLPEATIVWQSVTPSPKAWNTIRKRQQNATERAKKVLDKYPNAFFLDAEPFVVNENGELIEQRFRDDGVHYNREGGIAYKAFMRPYVESYWEKVNQ